MNDRNFAIWNIILDDWYHLLLNKAPPEVFSKFKPFIKQLKSDDIESSSKLLDLPPDIKKSFIAYINNIYDQISNTPEEDIDNLTMSLNVIELVDMSLFAVEHPEMLKTSIDSSKFLSEPQLKSHISKEWEILLEQIKESTLEERKDFAKITSGSSADVIQKFLEDLVFDIQFIIKKSLTDSDSEIVKSALEKVKTGKLPLPTEEENPINELHAFLMSVVEKLASNTYSPDDLRIGKDLIALDMAEKLFSLLSTKEGKKIIEEFVSIQPVIETTPPGKESPKFEKILVLPQNKFKDNWDWFYSFLNSIKNDIILQFSEPYNSWIERFLLLLISSPNIKDNLDIAKNLEGLFAISNELLNIANDFYNHTQDFEDWEKSQKNNIYNLFNNLISNETDWYSFQNGINILEKATKQKPLVEKEKVEKISESDLIARTEETELIIETISNEIRLAFAKILSDVRKNLEKLLEIDDFSTAERFLLSLSSSTDLILDLKRKAATDKVQNFLDTLINSLPSISKNDNNIPLINELTRILADCIKDPWGKESIILFLNQMEKDRKRKILEQAQVPVIGIEIKPESIEPSITPAKKVEAVPFYEDIFKFILKKVQKEISEAIPEKDIIHINTFFTSILNSSNILNDLEKAEDSFIKPIVKIIKNLYTKIKSLNKEELDSNTDNFIYELKNSLIKELIPEKIKKALPEEEFIPKDIILLKIDQLKELIETCLTSYEKETLIKSIYNKICELYDTSTLTELETLKTMSSNIKEQINSLLESGLKTFSESYLRLILEGAGLMRLFTLAPNAEMDWFSYLERLKNASRIEKSFTIHQKPEVPEFVISESENLDEIIKEIIPETEIIVPEEPLTPTREQSLPVEKVEIPEPVEEEIISKEEAPAEEQEPVSAEKEETLEEIAHSLKDLFEQKPEVPDKEILFTFIDDTLDRLEKINQSLLIYERDPENDEVLNELMRHFHTLKGDAGLVKKENISNLSHIIEDLISTAQKEKMSISEEGINILFRSVDTLYRLVMALRGGIEPPDDSVITSISNELSNQKNLLIQRSIIKEEIQVLPSITTPAAESIKEIEPAQSIRVNLDHLEKLMGDASEMVIARTRLQDLVNSLNELVRCFYESKESLRTTIKKVIHFLQTVASPVKKKSFYSEQSELLEKHQAISREMRLILESISNNVDEISNLANLFEKNLSQVSIITSSIHNEVLKMRMIPVEKLFHRFPRASRDLAKSEGKKIRMILEGTDTILDKTVLDGIAEPLNHLIRNAIIHGIEFPDERKQKGKNEEGVIKLSAQYKGGQVIIEVEDDGMGLDIDAIKNYIKENNLLPPDKISQLSDKEILQYIFYPGVTTRKKADLSSGRGFGLNVVKESINNLKGYIEVISSKDEGTRFSISLPLTLTITQSILVSVSEEIFAIPLPFVSEIIEIPKSSINQVGDKEVFELRNEVITLIRLNRLLKLPEIDTLSDKYLITILYDRETKIGLLVDKILKREEIVIKTLGPFSKHIPYFSGATILGNNRVVLILDAYTLIHQSEKTPFKPSIPSEPEKEIAVKPVLIKPKRKDLQRKQVILIVDDSNYVRNYVKEILKNADYETKEASDGEEALNIIAEEVIDAIIMDIDLPKIHGFEIISKIRQSAKTRDLPVVVLTARAGESNRRRCMEIGADSYILKPFHENELLATLSSLLD